MFSQAAVTQVHPKNGVHLTLEDVKRNMIADGNSKLQGDSMIWLILKTIDSPLSTDPRGLLGEYP
jgi:hypothetical protein